MDPNKYFTGIRERFRHKYYNFEAIARLIHNNAKLKQLNCICVVLLYMHTHLLSLEQQKLPTTYHMQHAALSKVDLGIREANDSFNFVRNS